MEDIPLEVALGVNQSEYYHLYTLPSQFTLQVTANGTAGVFGSFTVRNPNPVTADFIIDGEEMQHYYIINESELFLTVVSFSSENVAVRITKEFHDTTNSGKTIDIATTIGFTVEPHISRIHILII